MKHTAVTFFEKVDTGEGLGCWRWLGGQHQDTGYGTVSFGNRTRLAHRVAYELGIGPIPAGLDLGHLCRVRLCVNPYHLEPVTERENILRGETLAAFNAAKTQCKRGHDLASQASLFTTKSGRVERRCRPCHAAYMRDWNVSRKS